MLLTSLIKDKYSNLGTKFVVSKKQHLYSYNDENTDFIIKTQFSYPIEESFIFDSKEEYPLSDNPEDLISRIETLTKSPQIDSFSLSKDYISIFQDTIRHYKSTHLRFFTIKNHVRVRLFDLRDFIYNTSLKGVYSETSLRNTSVEYDFSFTIKAESFLNLIEHEYDVEVLENGVVIFGSTEDEVEYIFRDQQLVEPVIEFTHSDLKLDTCLLIHSN
jgi:hypothetical protein